MDVTAVDQIAIALTGVAACWLSQDTRTRFARWACLFGLLSQPFYFYATYVAEQWGMFVASVAFTGAWIRGLYNFWLKPWLAARAKRTEVAGGSPALRHSRLNWSGPKSAYRPWPQND